jgi:hypothetical protein
MAYTSIPKPRAEKCAMDKLQLTGQNLGRVFDFRSGRLHAATYLVLSVKLPNLQLKTQPTQLLGSLPLVIVLPNCAKVLSCWLKCVHALASSDMIAGDLILLDEVCRVSPEWLGQ